MKNYSAFDIIGPQMVGPSSSHTAGAVRLSKIAGELVDYDVKKVQFILTWFFCKNLQRSWNG